MRLKRTFVVLLFLATSSAAQATTCEYYIGYIKGESEREWAVKKMYRYSDERLAKIKALKEKGQALCKGGKQDEGKEVLLDAVKLINFTRLQ